MPSNGADNAAINEPQPASPSRPRSARAEFEGGPEAKQCLEIQFRYRNDATVVDTGGVALVDVVTAEGRNLTFGNDR